jgi:hypothetical protein
VDDRETEFRLRAGAEIFLFSVRQNQSPIQRILRTVSSEIKRRERELDHSPSRIVPKFKNAWGHTSTPLQLRMEWCLTKHKGLYLYLLYVGQTYPISGHRAALFIGKTL